MAEECPLAAPLTLKDTQSGVVGETGTVWAIAPDCSFTISRQIGTKLLDPHKHGRLTPEQQARLRQILDQLGEAHFAPTPEPAAQVNPHRITLSYGDRHAALILPAAGAPHAAAGDERSKVLLELTDTIRDMLGR